MRCLSSLPSKYFQTLAFLLGLFISVSTPVFAQSNDNADAYNFYGRISSYFSKEYTIDPNNVDNPRALTNYDQQDRDVTFRALDDSERTFQKGVYIKQVLNGKYEDRILAYTCDNNCYIKGTQPEDCNPVKISTLAYYYYRKNIPILYEENNKETPSSYDPSKFDTTYQFISDDSCYTGLYEGLSIVPRGTVESLTNGAPVSSKQLHSGLKTPVDQTTQDKASQVSIWEWILNLFGLIDKNKKQEKIMLAQFIPDKNNNQNDENGIMKTKFTDYMFPYSWQKAPPERGNNSNGEGGHSKGLSQYGAQGRALSGQKYDEILKAYYGSNSMIKTIDTSNAKIEIIPAHEIIDFEGNYLMGIAEMPDSWEMEALKAQVIAARTYAYVRTNQFAKPICVDTYCQVYKPEHIAVSPRWRQAVLETAGQILVDSATQQPFLTMYSAWNGGQSISYDDSGHTTASVNDSEFERRAGAPY